MYNKKNLRSCLIILLFIFMTNIMAENKENIAVSYSKLPRWRGFNLLEKFSKNWSSGPFLEEDFKLISELGFNFVRLPMDYRTWIKNNDWAAIDQEVMKDIDRAIEWGKKYNIHVNINFHRAPGYCVNPPNEPKDLWTDIDAQNVCAMHWAYFAKRYRKISNKNLSFNLFNEPGDINKEAYINVVKIMVKAIRKQDPNRLIIVDGLKWGTEPLMELKDLNIAEATRGYVPFNISHFRASWVSGSDNMPTPVWPMPKINSFIYGPFKKEFATPLIIEGNFEKIFVLRVKVDTVSTSSELVVKVDGNRIWGKQFICAGGDGEWEKAVYQPQWQVYQNVYNKSYSINIPAGAKKIEIENISGDWLTISEIGLSFKKNEENVIIPNNYEWGQKQSVIYYDPKNAETPFRYSNTEDKDWLWKTYIEPFKKLEAEGVGIMVGEWGAFSKTPHPVVLKWMKDCLENWKQADWGWAMWNFRGDFGILDSNRNDVQYEEFKGHKLDRKMLELIQEY